MKALLILLALLYPRLCYAQSDIKWVRTNHIGYTSSLALTSDDKILVSTSKLDSEIIVWDAKTDVFIKRFHLEGSATINASAFLPNSNTLIVCGEHGLLYIDIERERVTEVIPLPEAANAIYLKVSSTGDTLLWVTNNGDSLYRYDKQAHTLIDNININTDFWNGTKFCSSPDLRYFSSSTYDCKIFDLELDTVFPVSLDGYYLTTYYFVDNNSLIAEAKEKGSSKRKRVVVDLPASIVRDTVILDACFLYSFVSIASSDCQTYFFADVVGTPEMNKYNGHIYVFRTGDSVYKPITGLRAHSFAINPLTQNIYAAGSEGTTSYETESGFTAGFDLNSLGNDNRTAVSFSSSGQLAYYSSTFQPPFSAHYAIDGKRIDNLPYYCINRVEWDPIDNRVAIGVEMIDLDASVKSINTCQQACGRWHPSGSHYIWSKYNDTLVIEDRNGGREYLPTGQLRINDIAVSPNGAYIATAGSDNQIQLWTLDKQLIRTYQGHTGQVTSVDFAPNSRFLVSASTDTTLRVWDIDRGEVHRYDKFKEIPVQVNVSFDGSTVVARTSKSVVAYDALQWANVKPRLVMNDCSISACRVERNLLIQHDFESPGRFTIEIFDMLGRLLAKTSHEYASTFYIDITTIPQQALLVRVISDNESASTLVQ